MTNEPTATDGVVKEEEQNQQGQTFTAEEFEKRLQSEVDKRITTAQAKWESRQQQLIQQERADAEKLARLSAEEREKELLERTQKELSAKDKELTRREMKITAIDILSEKKLPVHFADMVIADSAEETNQRISKLEKSWRAAIDEEKKNILASKKPVNGKPETPKQDANDWIRSMAKPKGK